MFNTILLAYDGSDHARNALNAAAELARVHGAKLHLVHTPQVDTPTIVVGAYVSQLDTPPTPEQIQQAGKHVTDQAINEAKALGVAIEEVHLGTGVPANVVLTHAKKIDADLIVMGRRGLGAIRALALGSVSQAIAHGAECACLTVV